MSWHWWHRHHHHPEREPRISLLVPFRSDHGRREIVWAWLREYWEENLPGCEIIVGRDREADEDADDDLPRWLSPGWFARRRHHHGHEHGHERPFSKTAAVNDAFGRSSGDIIVILDADAYVDAEVILHCAKRIRHARRRHVPLWFVPYQTILRLTEEATEEILERWPGPIAPPDLDDVEDSVGSLFGHKYGAMIQIMPREAFLEVGGMDPRFRGWGGEDVCFLRALDCLFGKHRTTPNSVLHLWHPKFHIGRPGGVGDAWKTRVRAGQDETRMNDKLAVRYDRARTREAMRAIVDEGLNPDDGPGKRGWR